MKKLWKGLAALLILLSTLAVAGCLPPNYSKDKAKKIVEDHQQEAFAWFQQQLPETQVDKKVEPYATGIDLLGAIRGEYKYKGKTYKYVYSYSDKKMYVSQGYDQVCELVKSKVLQELGYSTAETSFEFQGYTFEAANENDTPKRSDNESKDGKRLRSSSEKLVPAWLTPEQFAQAVLAPNTEERFNFFVNVYRDQFPERPTAALDKFKNLGTVWCHRPIDLAKEPQGICSKLYNHKQGKTWSYHVTKVSDDLYAGYLAYKDLPVEDKLKVTKKSDKEFTLEIPEHCKPIFFSKKALTLVHSFKGAAGNEVNNVADEMYKSSYPGRKDVHTYGSHFSLVGDYTAYDTLTVNLVKGVYNFKLLGIFDLEYWKLKF